MRGSEFAEMKAFAAIVERASFARAAEQLGLSPSALSQTIRQLETRLGVRLLNRTTRSVAPTATGSRLYERIAPMILELDAAVAEVVASTGRTAGTLRINALGMAAKKVISTRLGRFHDTHPGVVLDIVIDDSLSDIVAGRFDAGIRVGRRLENDMTVIRLTRTSGLSWPRRLTILLGTECQPRLSTCGAMPASTRVFPAEMEFRAGSSRRRGKKVEIAVEGPLIANHQDFGVAAALQGLSILYAYDDDGVGQAIEQGRLERILADWSPVRPGLYLYYSNRVTPNLYFAPSLTACLEETGPRPSAECEHSLGCG
jgi:DNA-binding transcriptional LysR family regulator